MPATWKDLIAALDTIPARSTWARGVREYAREILMERDEEGASFEGMEDPATRKAKLLNGARSWQEYSAGGCAFAYDGDIIQRLMTPSEQKRLRYREGGWKDPNPMENWIDVQARALMQAACLINRAMGKLA